MTRPRPTPRRHPKRNLKRAEETSAGGLVVDCSTVPPNAALIGRLDRRGQLLWLLPKGHVEEGETLEDAALREVAEETGIRGRVVAAIGTIDFWFVADLRHIHKTVHHYLLIAEGGELSTADGEVAEVRWVPLEEIATLLAYDDERRLIDKVPYLLAESA